MIAAFRYYLLRAAFGVLLLACVVIALAGCGGGDADGDQIDVPTPRVDCVAHPEACR